MSVEVQHDADTHTKATLTISVEPAEIASAKDKAFGQYTRKLTVPGFRPGKAPRHLIEKWIDQKQLMQLAIERVITDTYTTALKETGVHPYPNADPKFDLPEEEIKGEEGFTYTVTVALEPHVHLGEISGLAAKRVVTPITDDEVNREIDRLREQTAHFHESEDGAAEIGDRVRLTAQITMDGQPVTEASIDEPTIVLLGANFETFDQALEGIKPGEERTFDFTYPDDFADEDLRNKPATATVKAYELHKRHMYDADDEFAKIVGQESLESLKAQIKEALQRQADAVTENELHDSLMQQIQRNSQVHYPDEMVDHEASNALRGMITQLEERSLTLNDYLRSRETDLRTLEAALKSEARQRIERTLVLLEIARANDLAVTEKEVENEIKRRAESEDVKLSQMRRYLNDNNEMQNLREGLFYRKVTDFLESKADITDVAA
jgi:trigger factor